MNGKVGICGMPNFNNWYMVHETVINEADRAIAAYNRILDKPSTITIDRLGTAQTVRIEYNRYILDEMGTASPNTVELRLVLFGIRNHPTEDDNDFQSDEFYYNFEKYKIESAWFTIGEIQAIAIKMN